MCRIEIIKNWSLKKVIWTKYFEITDSYIFRLFYWKVNYKIEVPVLFLSDFGSIPAIFFNFDKTKYISYLLHDFLYSYIWEIIVDDDSDLFLCELWELLYNQKLADEILIAWLDIEWMNKPWRIIISLWLLIWWRFCFKNKKKKISRLKRNIKIKKENNLIY